MRPHGALTDLWATAPRRDPLPVRSNNESARFDAGARGGRAARARSQPPVVETDRAMIEPSPSTRAVARTLLRGRGRWSVGPEGGVELPLRPGPGKAAHMSWICSPQVVRAFSWVEIPRPGHSDAPVSAWGPGDRDRDRDRVQIPKGVHSTE